MVWETFLDEWAGAVGHGQLRYVLAAVTAFVFSLIAGAYLIRVFRARRVFEDTSQPDCAVLDAIQTTKQNVPTMGGVMILCGVFAALLLWADLRSPHTVNAILCMATLGAVGLVDDYLKLTRVCAAGSRGLSKKTKLILQTVIGVMVGYILFVNVRESEGATRLVLPFTGGWSLELGPGYLLWATLVIVATSNAVNLADGLDGLAGGCTAIAAAALLGLGFVVLRAGSGAAAALPGGEDMCVVAAAVFGSVLGFLWYNAHPAQVFMGDTGSLALGGLLGYVALGLKLEVPLLAAGLVFFADELSVAVQIVGFKLTRKRLLPIAPIHHHFQMNLRWPEQKITARLCIIAALGALVSFALVALGEWR